MKLFILAAKKGRYSHAKRVETVRATAQYWTQKQNAGPSSGNIGYETSIDFMQATTTSEPLDKGPQNTTEKKITSIKQEQPVTDEHRNQVHQVHEKAPEAQYSHHPQLTVEYRESPTDTAGLPDTSSEVNVTTACENNRTERGDSQNKAINSGYSLSDEIFRFIKPSSEELQGL